MTELFPEKAPIYIKQNDVGDCYLLAALHYLFKDQQGLKIVSSLFEKLPSGSVRVRIKQNLYSNNLIHKTLRGAMSDKFEYRFDADNGVDEFIISKASLEQIDSNTEGVQSNSLAVKILELLVSFYLGTNKMNPHKVRNRRKAIAHSLKDYDGLSEHSKSRTHQSDFEFIATLLGIKVIEPTTKRLISLISLFEESSNVSALISMKYGRSDDFGKIHERHALVIENIVPNTKSAGGYDFILVNPWNTNAESEAYSLNDILLRAPFFALFDINPILSVRLNELFEIPDEKEKAFNEILAKGVLSNTLIRHGLAVYYFSEDDSWIVNDQILALFANKTFDKLFLSQILTVDELIFGALVSLSSGSDLTEHCEFIRLWKSHLPWNDFVEKLVLCCDFDSPVSLYYFIYKVSEINSPLADHLFHAVKDQIPSFFTPQISYYDSMDAAKRSLSIPFRTWFEIVSGANREVPGAQDVVVFVQQLKIKIDGLIVDYSECATPEDLQEQKLLLLRRVSLLVKQYAARPGFADPLQYMDVKTAYEQKKQVINTLAEATASTLKAKESEGVVERGFFASSVPAPGDEVVDTFEKDSIRYTS